MGIAKDSIAIPTRDTPETREAFRTVLRDLFVQYPPIIGVVNKNDPYSYTPSIAAMHRDNSMNEWRSPATMAYYACDTGVPNELILSAYTLIFL